MGQRLVYGTHPVLEALRRREGQVQGLMVSKPALFHELVALAEAKHIPVQTTSLLELELLCGHANHQGVAALVGEYAYLELEDLLEIKGGTSLLLVLDSITDPQNLGSIIRSALVLGATGLVLPKDRSASVTPSVVKVSAGASEHLPIARVTNLARTLEQLKESGCWIAGAVERGGVLPESLDLRGPTALVLGNEHKGIRPLVLRGCDVLVTTPSAAEIASLNVAAATVALLAEAARQRRQNVQAL
jgi:23S rRNA (guanosine2251-2'-O)-methyltransferase